MEWTIKKKPIIQNLNTAIVNRERVLEDIEYSQYDLGDFVDQMNDELKRLYTMRNLVQNDDIHIQVNPAVEGSIDILAYFSASEAQHTQRMTEGMGAIRTDIESLKQYVKMSMGTAIPSMTSGIISISQYMEPRSHVYQYTESLKDPTPRDRRKELSKKLSAIDSRLSIKLEGAWQTIQDYSKADRLLQAASSIRELISDFLHTLSPDEKITLMAWFQPETPNGRPTQKQRARYAMLGTNTKVNEENLEPVFELSKGIRDTYKKLNKIAHLRDYEKELDTLTLSLIDQCQIYLLKLLEIRSLYYLP